MSITSPHLPYGFRRAPCGFCNGQGVTESAAPCQPCKGTGRIIAHYPPAVCQRCNGSGRAVAGEQSEPLFCPSCHGAGWAMALLD